MTEPRLQGWTLWKYPWRQEVKNIVPRECAREMQTCMSLPPFQLSSMLFWIIQFSYTCSTKHVHDSWKWSQFHCL